MLMQQALIGNSVAGIAQWDAIQYARNMANVQESMMAATARTAGMTVNAGLVPQDVYRDFDTVTVQRMRSDDGDTFLNDLLPLSRSISIGKLVQEFKQSSDAGRAQTSMTGQIGVKMDQVEYTFDGSIIPIHDTGFSRNWREWNAMQSEGFDGLVDDQRESVATLRRHLADNLMDGHTDTQGNFINVDTFDWQGMRNDSRVIAVDLGGGGLNFDFTDQSKTGEQIKNVFIQIRDTLFITNNCEKDVTYYVSREIMSNFERRFSTQYDAKLIKQELASLMGVADIKVTSKLTGNQLMAFPLDADKIRPLVGMGMNTVAMPRPVYNSDYQFVVWAAIGWQVRVDFAGNSCAMYASA